MPSMLAVKERPFPGGPIDLRPDKVEIFDEADEFSTRSEWSGRRACGTFKFRRLWNRDQTG